MNPIEVTLTLLVLTASVPLLKWARGRGEKQRVQFEQESLSFLHADLASRAGKNLDSYAVFTSPNWNTGTVRWSESSLEEMEELIIANVAKPTGGYGTSYGKAAYSIHVDRKNKDIYYVVGNPLFNFKNLKSGKV